MACYILEDGQRSARRRRGAQEGTPEGRRGVGWCSGVRSGVRSGVGQEWDGRLERMG